MTQRFLARSRGFTLIELAVVVGVVGLLLGALLVPLATQYEMRQLVNEQRRQKEIRDAIIGFALVNRRLPCPDNDAFGAPGVGDEDFDDTIDDCTGPTGPVYAGFLPGNTLGVQPVDTWGRRYFYRVDSDFVAPSTPGTPAPNLAGLDLLDAGNITVQDRPQSKVPFNLTDDAAAVVWSAGPNGHGATNLENTVIAAPAAPPTLTDENENNDGDQIYVARQRTEGNATCSDVPPVPPVLPFCEFDDIVTWVPTSLLKLRMVEAGALP